MSTAKKPFYDEEGNWIDPNAIVLYTPDADPDDWMGMEFVDPDDDDFDEEAPNLYDEVTVKHLGFNPLELLKKRESA